MSGFAFLRKPIIAIAHSRTGQRLKHAGRAAMLCPLQLGRAVSLPDIVAHVLIRVRTRLSAGGGWIRTSGTADDARLLGDLYAHNASRQMPQKGSSDQTVACFRRLGAGVVGSAAVCAFVSPGNGQQEGRLAPIARLLRRGVLRTG